MTINPIPNIAIQHSFDIKLEKNIESEETRAIEDSSESDKSKPEANQQNIVKKEATTNSSKDGDIGSETYNAKGYLAREVIPEAMDKQQGSSINLIV